MNMNRFLEPSTWAGIAAILAALAPMVAPFSPEGGWLVSGLATFSGGLAVKLREFPNQK